MQINRPSNPHEDSVKEQGTVLEGMSGNSAKSAKSVKKYDIDKLIDAHRDPDKWVDHVTDDLMKFWNNNNHPGPTDFVQGLFPTYLTNKGELLPENEADWPIEFQEAKKEKLKELIDTDNIYIRAHSRQTYAYGIAYHMTGEDEYLELCQKGAYALMDAFDGNHGMYTKKNIRTGKWDTNRSRRTSQDLAYGITGMAMYYYLTHDDKVLYKILEAKNYIFDKYFDQGKGIFTWYPKEENNAQIEIVALLDQIYGYMIWLTPALPEPYQSEWKSDLKKLVNILIHRFYSERYKFFWGQSTSAETSRLGQDHTDFGHSVKTMWLIYEIGVYTQETSFVIFAQKHIHKILKEAYMEDTDMEDTGSWARRFDENGKLDKDKEWWGLAELDQACQILALNDPSYLTQLNKTQDYWFKNMVDYDYGEIHHMVRASDNKPVIYFPKTHSWKTSLHSFEHALFGYMTSSEIKNKDFDLYYAFTSSEEINYDRVAPYLFRGNMKNIKMNSDSLLDDNYKKVTITYNMLH